MVALPGMSESEAGAGVRSTCAGLFILNQIQLTDVLGAPPPLSPRTRQELGQSMHALAFNDKLIFPRNLPILNLAVSAL